MMIEECGSFRVITLLRDSPIETIDRLLLHIIDSWSTRQRCIMRMIVPVEPIASEGSLVVGHAEREICKSLIAAVSPRMILELELSWHWSYQSFGPIWHNGPALADPVMSARTREQEFNNLILIATGTTIPQLPRNDQHISDDRAWASPDWSAPDTSKPYPLDSLLRTSDDLTE